MSCLNLICASLTFFSLAVAYAGDEPRPGDPKGTPEQKASGYRFTVKVDGNDLVVENVAAVPFGSMEEHNDVVETEGGVELQKKGKDLQVEGCSLPMSGYAERNYTGVNTSGSPIPALPYRSTKVEVTYRGRTITVPLIERGPGPDAPDGAAIGLTYKSFAEFAPPGEGKLTGVSFRILGAAKYLQKPYVPPSAR